jgi:hypothetical protein
VRQNYYPCRAFSVLLLWNRPGPPHRRRGGPFSSCVVTRPRAREDWFDNYAIAAAFAAREESRAGQIAEDGVAM